MYKVLRIVFCILAVAAAAVSVLIFIFFNLWGLIPVGLCIVFAAAMFLCRSAQIKDETRKNPPAPQGDFITGKVKKSNESDLPHQSGK